MLQFFTTNNVFYKPPQKKPEESNMENERARKWAPSDIFLAMMENTALRHVLMRTVVHLDGAPPHLMFMPFWTGSFLITG